MRIPSSPPVFLVILLAALVAVAPSARAEDPPPTDLDPVSVTQGFDRIPVEELDEPAAGLEDLGEMVVTATRTRTREFDVPRAVDVIREARIRERGVTNIVDSLDDQVGIWVEKRTSHTSDPVIRGLSGSNLLALIDGNTLSTFWGEGGFAGDDMYGKINPDNIARLEVVRGPGSVLYGSNALGGVLNFITRESPFDYTACGTRWGGRVYLQGNTAAEGWRMHLEGYGASSRFRWIAGVTYMDYTGTRDGSGQWQSPTDAQGGFADVALNWKISEIAYAKFTIQYTHLDPVYRYYRPTQDNENTRVAVAGTIEFVDLERRVGFADNARLTLYYQDKQDERRWFDAATNAITREGVAKWRTVQFDAQADKQLGCHALTYGIEFEGTAGESPDDEQYTLTYPDGTKEKPAPDSLWSSLGVYVHDVWQVNPWLTLTGSARFDMFHFKTDVDEYYAPPGNVDPSIDEIEEWQPAFAGGLQAMTPLGRNTNVYGGWTRGFRQFAPRFGIVEQGAGLFVPGDFLDPVTGDQFEVGIKHNSQYVKAELIGYYTYYDNFQNAVPGTYQGSDWYDYNGNGMRDPGEDVYVVVGNGSAFVYGAEAFLNVNFAAIDPCFFGEAWSVFLGFTYNYGQDETNDIPLRHTQPMTGLFRLRWEPLQSAPRPWFELAAKFVDRYDRIPPDRLANDVGYLEDPQDPSSGMRREWGLPGYSVWDLRGGFTVSDHVELTFGMNNIFDKLYRAAHARMDAPGMNFYAALNIVF